MYNYAASVAFGSLAIALLFAYSAVNGNVGAMRVCILVAVVAWLACYVGYIGETADSNAAKIMSAMCTVCAVMMFVVAMFK